MRKASGGFILFEKSRSSKIWMMPIQYWCLCLQLVNKVKMERIIVFTKNRELAF